MRQAILHEQKYWAIDQSFNQDTFPVVFILSLSCFASKFPCLSMLMTISVIFQRVGTVSRRSVRCFAFVAPLVALGFITFWSTGCLSAQLSGRCSRLIIISPQVTVLCYASHPRMYFIAAAIAGSSAKQLQHRQYSIGAQGINQLAHIIGNSRPERSKRSVGVETAEL